MLAAVSPKQLITAKLGLVRCSLTSLEMSIQLELLVSRYARHGAGYSKDNTDCKKNMLP